MVTDNAIKIKPAAYINFLFIKINLKAKILKLFSFKTSFSIKWLQMEKIIRVDASIY